LRDRLGVLLRLAPPLCTVAFMSTVAINLRDVFGVAAGCDVIFNPLDTPYVDGAALTVSGARSVRLDGQGLGSVALLPGRYSVRFSGIAGNTDALSVTVPNDSATYSLTALTSGTGVVTPPPDYLRLSSLSAAGHALLTAADTAGQRAVLGLRTSALFNVAATGNASLQEVVKGDDTRLNPPVPDIWPLWQKRYFCYDPTVDGAGDALLAQKMAASRGTNPQYALPPGFSAFTTATNHYPVFAIMWADNADLIQLVTTGGNVLPCIIGLATWNGDLALEGALTSNSLGLMDSYFSYGMPAGDFNGDGVCDGADQAILTELFSN